MDLVFYNAELDEMVLFDTSVHTRQWFNKNGSIKELNLAVKITSSSDEMFFIGFIDLKEK